MAGAFFRPWQRRTSLWPERTRLWTGAERLAGVIRPLDPEALAFLDQGIHGGGTPTHRCSGDCRNHFRQCPDVCVWETLVKKALLAGVAVLSVLSVPGAFARPQVIVGKPKIIYFKISMYPPAKYDGDSLFFGH